MYWDVEGRYVKSSTDTQLSDLGDASEGYANSKIHELIESEEHLKAYRKAGTSAYVLPGPQPYWCDGVGQAILTEVKLRVGSQYVDTLYSDYLYMWDELSDKPGRHTDSEGYGRMCMKGSAAKRKCWSQTTSDVYVPIPMFFMRTSGNALPLIALQFHGVQIVLTCSDPTKHIINSAGNKVRDGIDSLFNDNNKTTTWPPPPKSHRLQDCCPWHRCVHRRCRQRLGCRNRFIPVVPGKHPRLFQDRGRPRTLPRQPERRLRLPERHRAQQVRRRQLRDPHRPGSEEHRHRDQPEDVSAVSLSINTMVQELIWACKRDSNLDIRHEPFNYRGEVDRVNGVARDPIESVQLRLNNSTRFNMNDGQDVNAAYFRTVEPYLHHTRIPDNHIYSYSFALNPESEQPSGAINMSRIDNAKLSITMSDALPFSGKGYHVKDSLARELVDGASKSGDANALDYSQLTLRLFARNWNVFRVTLGLGGTKWAA